jgi:hypothetical protein
MSRRHKSRFTGMHRDLRWLGREIREAGGADAVWPQRFDNPNEPARHTVALEPKPKLVTVISPHERACAVIRLERIPGEPDADFIARFRRICP